jgi:hypothetical protein
MLELYDPLAGERICEFLGLPPTKLGHSDYMQGRDPLLRQGLRIARSAWRRVALIAGVLLQRLHDPGA